MIRNIIFDLDGTITDSQKGIVNGVKHTVSEMNLELDPKLYTEFIGPPLEESFSKFTNLEGDAVTDAVATFRSYYLEKGWLEMNLYDGIEDTLRNLKQEGYDLYIATSKLYSSAKRILGRYELLDYFTYIAGATYDSSRVIKADVIAYLLEREGLDTEESIMVGDRANDIEGALENSLKAVGVSYGYGHDEEFKNAIAVVDSPAELYSFFKNLSDKRVNKYD
ncbi:MAG: HAD-IA family hydrolase [Finegoldia sp.]|nr:HAD-IA family hydrolase [Finegoldia sp.]